VRARVEYDAIVSNKSFRIATPRHKTNLFFLAAFFSAFTHFETFVFRTHHAVPHSLPLPLFEFLQIDRTRRLLANCVTVVFYADTSWPFFREGVNQRAIALRAAPAGAWSNW
jgi:hypothetical protein